MHQWISRCFWVHFCLKKSPCKKVKAVYPTTQVLGLRKKWDGCALAAREPDRKNRTVKLCILGPNVIFSAHWPNEDGWHSTRMGGTGIIRSLLAPCYSCFLNNHWLRTLNAGTTLLGLGVCARGNKDAKSIGTQNVAAFWASIASCALGSLEGTLDYRTAPLSAHFSATTWYSLRRLGACNCSDLRRPCACD